jgi:hypothetical protein
MPFQKYPKLNKYVVDTVSQKYDEIKVLRSIAASILLFE